jgi:hypothetical protein
MRTRLFFAAIGAALVLAVPATASADLLSSFHDAVEGSQQPIPGGRANVSFGSDENPCRYYSFAAGQQDGYNGLTDNVETWKQAGRVPALLPPGTFWEKGDDEGSFPTEKGAVDAIPAGVTTAPPGAVTITTSRWTAAPTGKLTPYQPETTLACSAAYRMDYTGSWSPLFSKGAEVTAVCKDAKASTPFVQWIQNLEKDTPALFEGMSLEKTLIATLDNVVKVGGTKTAKTILINTFKELWGGKPSNLLGVSLVQTALNAAVDAYLKEVAKQTEPMSNAVWDYTVNGGNFWSYWAPAKSRMTAGKLAINVVSSNPAAGQAQIRMACTSTPTLQGSVLNLNPEPGKNLVFPLEVHGAAYYGTPLGGGKRATVKARAATASDAGDEPTADGPAQSSAADETVVGTGKKKLDVATGPGSDEIFGSAGDDVLRAGTGDDKVIGGPGSDELIAGSGEDLLVDHSAAPNTFIGGDGTDRIDARHEGDQVDTINCGTGEDIVLAEAQDDVSDTCEHVFFSTDEAPHDLDDALKEARNWPR